MKSLILVCLAAAITFFLFNCCSFLDHEIDTGIRNYDTIAHFDFNYNIKDQGPYQHTVLNFGTKSTYGADSINNTAIHFDENSYFVVNHHPILELLPPFTISTLLKIVEPGVIMYQGDFNSGPSYSLQTSESNLSLTNSSCKANIPIDEWFRLTVTLQMKYESDLIYSDSTAILQVFLNDSLIQTKEEVLRNYIYGRSLNDLYIGIKQGGIGKNKFSGSLDQFIILSYAFSEEQVKSEFFPNK